MTEQNKNIVQPQGFEQTGGLVHPEEMEVFAGQRVLVVGGSDAHGISMAVTTAKYLEEHGASADLYAGSPVIREGKGATHSSAFFKKTLPILGVEGVDRVVIADIPLDVKDLKGAEVQLIDLTQRLAADRKKRGLEPIEHSVFFLDHHSTSQFEPAWQPGFGRGPAPRNVELYGVVIKNTATAEACRFGKAPSKVARIGAIADRDPSVLPVIDEEMVLARGLDIAIRPDVDDPRPVLASDASEDEKLLYPTQLKAWEDRVQARLENAIHRLADEDWDYFRQEALAAPKVDVPTASGYGQIAIVDTQGLTKSYSVLKLMESAIENQGAADIPYAIGIQRDLGDKEKMNREPADTISIIRHWTREDLPTVETVVKSKLPEDLVRELGMYGHPNAKSMRLSVNDRETAYIAARLVEAFAGAEMPDFSEIRSVVMCGDPNSGKSVFSTIFREALRTLGVRVQHLDLDKAAPTPQWYLDAEIAYKEAERLLARGKITDAQLAEKRQQLEDAAARRKAMKRPWSIDLAEEAKQELIAAANDHDTEFVIGDIGGGRISKDPETGKIVKIQRLTAENARILEGADAVIIVSNNPQGMREWQQLIESGVDPETGIRINRDKPIEIIGMYQSVLEGSVQKVPGGREEAGVVTNLDRSKAECIYNPTVFTTAMFINEAVERRRAKNGNGRVTHKQE